MQSSMFNLTVTEIGTEDKSRRYCVRAHPLDQMTVADFVWPPISLPDADHILPDLEHKLRTVSRVQLQQIGAALFESLFPQPVHDQYLNRQKRSRDFRINLAIDSSTLAIVPWEFLCDPSGGWMGLDRRRPLVRSLTGTSIADPLPVSGQLRILFAGANPRGPKADKYRLAPLEIEQDNANLKKALTPLIDQGLVKWLEPLMHTTYEGLRRCLIETSPHILHFSGHGGFFSTPRSSRLLGSFSWLSAVKNALPWYRKANRSEISPAPLGVLALEDADTGGDLALIGGDSIRVLLQGLDLRLVVLSACSTAATSVKAPFAGLAQQLIFAADLPAVIAMQFRILDTHAHIFNETLYHALANRLSLDRAVSEGRLAVYGDIFRDALSLPTGPTILGWAAPVLYLNSESADLWVSTIADDRDIPSPQLYKEAMEVHDAPRLLMGQGEVAAQFYKEGAEMDGAPKILFGREELAARIDGWLNDRKRVLVHGLPGSGKTALARALTAWRISRGKGPVLWLEVGNEPPERLIAAIAEKLATKKELLEVAVQQELDALIKLIGHQMAEQAQMVVLDNVWNAETLRQLLAAIPGEIPVLITSRLYIHFSNEEKIVALTDLDDDGALHLLAYSAGKGKEISGEFIPSSAFIADPDALSLCKELGNHPYALEIAGAFLGDPYNLSPGRLLQDIHASPHRLTMPEGGALPGRESVGKLLEVSWQKLDPESQKIYRAFGAFFAPSITDELLARYLKLDDVSLLHDPLNTLVAHGLIRRNILKTTEYGEDDLKVDREIEVFRLHALTFSFAQAVYDAANEKGNARLTSVETLLDFAQAMDEKKNYDVLALELSNLLGAVRTALDAARPEIAVSIMQRLVGGYLDDKGPSGDFAGALDAVLRYLRGRYQSGVLDDNALWQFNFLLGKRGNIAFDQGNYHLAYDCYQDALNLSVGDEKRSTFLGAALGKTCSFLGWRGEASKFFAAAHRRAARMGDRYLVTFILGQQSHAASAVKDYKGVRRMSLRQRKLNGELLAAKPDNELVLENQFYALLNLGTAELDLAGKSRALEAEAIHVEALKIADEKLDRDTLRAKALTALTEDAVIGEDQGKAGEYFLRAAALWLDLEKENEVGQLAVLMQKHGMPVPVQPGGRE